MLFIANGDLCTEVLDTDRLIALVSNSEFYVLEGHKHGDRISGL